MHTGKYLYSVKNKFVISKNILPTDLVYLDDETADTDFQKAEKCSDWLFACYLHDGHVFKVIVFRRPLVHGAYWSTKVITTSNIQLIISCNEK